MRVRMLAIIMVSMTGCASQQAGSVTEQEPNAVPTEVILRNTSWEDPELAEKGLGRLEVIVRVADRPAQVIQNAHVSLRLVGDGTSWTQKLTNDKGVVLFDSTRVGNYEMMVRAIGYGMARGRITVSRGCRSDVEAYIGLSAIGIAPPPPEPGRIRLTTCRVPQR